jgi:hypothetical protein
MISKKAIIALVVAAIVGVGTLAIPARALAHGWDHDGDGWRHQRHDNGLHRGWYKHRGEDEEEEHEGGGYYRQPYGNGYGEPDGDEGYPRNLPNYGYNSNGSINGMVNPRHPGLYWACDSQGHHCHWARRSGATYRYRQTRVNPGYPYGGWYNGYNTPYGSGATMNGLGTLVGPLLTAPMP